MDAPWVQGHINQPYSKLLQMRMSYDRRRTFVVGAQYRCESNGTLPPFVQDLRLAVRTMRMDGDIEARSPH